RIAVLREGRLQQVGTPEELYRAPTNRFVAAFVGRANFVAGRWVEGNAEEGTVEVAEAVRWRVRVHGAHPATGAPVRVMVRPESFRVAPGGGPPGGALDGTVIDRRFAGAVTVYRVDVAGV